MVITFKVLKLVFLSSIRSEINFQFTSTLAAVSPCQVLSHSLLWYRTPECWVGVADTTQTSWNWHTDNLEMPLKGQLASLLKS